MIKNNYVWLVLLVIAIIVFNSYSKGTKSGFQNSNNRWSYDLISRFNEYQYTVNRNHNNYDLNIVQQQASPQEVEQLLSTGYWPWPDYLKYEFLDKIASNPIISVEPQYALDNNMKTYNQEAAKQLLSWNTKEGQFLLYGANLGRTDDGLPDNTLKCNDNSIMEKTTYTDMSLWNGYYNLNTEPVKNEDIPKVMPGFQFVKSPCNPCVALNSPADYSCPFQLNVKGDNSVSRIWQKLWGL
jgi:hypothetical protein